VIECLEGVTYCLWLAGRQGEESGMRKMMDLEDVRWDRYPAVAGHDMARRWIETQVLLGMAPNTVDAYARGVQDFLAFCEGARILATEATRDQIVSRSELGGGEKPIWMSGEIARRGPLGASSCC